jgi:branched-chain amino acid transport system permease protein
VGINTVLYRLVIFVVSGLLTGLAGVVYLYWAQNITPETFTLDLSLAFLTMMILGGSRSLGGSLLGAVIIGALPEILKLLPSQIGQLDVQQSSAALYAILLLVALRLFPEGLWNAVAARLPRREVQSGC